MKKTFKKIACAFIAVLMTALVMGVAAEGSTIKVSLRIEGISGNIFYDTVETPAEDASLKSLLAGVAESDKKLDIVGLENNYITSIAGETAGKFGGWDGWLYSVNGEIPPVTVEQCTLKDGDVVVLFYGDPYGAGMQFPMVDSSKVNEGVISFKSNDTVYVDNEPVVTENPVVGASVSFLGKTFTTDEKGEINIDKGDLKNGEFTLAIDKKNDAGMPLVLRLASDFTVKISGIEENAESGSSSENQPASSIEDDKNSSSSKTENDGSSKNDSVVPKTGENDAIYYAVVLLAVCSGMFVTVKKRNEN